MSQVDSKIDDFDSINRANPISVKVMPSDSSSSHLKQSQQRQPNKLHQKQDTFDSKYDPVDRYPIQVTTPDSQHLNLLHITPTPDTDYLAHDILWNHSLSLEDRYDSILKNQIDHPTVLFSSKSSEKGSKHLLALLTALSTLLPQYLPSTHVSALSGEINFLDSNPYLLNNLSHDIRSSYYTNTVPTRHQISLTRDSGDLPHLEASSGLINGLIVALGTSHPEALDPAQINLANLSHPIGSSYITLSDLDIVPIVVDNVAQTTTTNTIVDPRSAQAKQQIVTTTQQLPSTIEYARGTSIERIFNTRNSGLIPTLIPSNPTTQLSTEFIQPINTRSSLPRLVISNPSSIQVIQLPSNDANSSTGTSTSTNVELALTQAEHDSLVKWICIQRNRNMGNISSARLSSLILENAGQQVLDVVKKEQAAIYSQELKSINENEHNELKLLDRLATDKKSEADKAFSDKKAILQSALDDYTLQLNEAKKRLKHSSEQISTLSTTHYKNLLEERGVLEKEIDALNREYKSYQTEWNSTHSSSSDALNTLEIDYNKQYSHLINSFNTKCDELKQQYDHSINAIPVGMNETTYKTQLDGLYSQREGLLSTYQHTIQQLDDAAQKQAVYLRQLAELDTHRSNLDTTRENALLDANTTISKRFDEWQKQYNDINNKLSSQERIVNDLRQQYQTLKSQTEDIFSQDELRLRGIGVELEHCYLLPHQDETIFKQVPTQIIITEQVVVEQPIVKKELHYEIELDPSLMPTTTTTTTTTTTRDGKVVKQNSTTPTTLTSNKPLASIVDELPQMSMIYILKQSIHKMFTTFNQIRENEPATTAGTATTNYHDHRFIQTLHYQSCVSPDTDDEDFEQSQPWATLTDASDNEFSHSD